jgi:hypothetical protein
MPWTVNDVDGFKKGLTPAQKKKWVKIANGVLAQCKSDGGKDCEGKAIRIANSKFEDGGDSMKKAQNLPKGAFRLDGGGQALLQFQEVEVDGAKTQKPKLKMVGYSGGVIKDHWYWGNLGIDLSGMKFTKDRYPLLQDHRTDVRLAHMGKPIIENNKLMAPEEDIVFLENEESQKFLSESAKGFPFQASIYAKPGKVIRLDEDQEHPCNGFIVKGPGAVWLESEFKEMSVCVFGADSNTSATAFSGDEPCAFTEVEFAGTEPVETTTKEVKRMDKEQFKKDHADLYAEIVAEVKAQFKAPEPDPEIQAMKAEVARLSEENKSLKKENDIRREKELKHEADDIWDSKLSESDLPDRLHEKVRAMVDYNKFVKDQSLDTKAFGEAVDAEIKSWVEMGIKKADVVLGESTTVKAPTGPDKTEEAKKLSDRLLQHVGQTKKN